MADFFENSTLLLVLLNPFFVILYLADVVQRLEYARFVRVLLRGAAISSAVFIVFALVGDQIFSRVLHADFASFQIFGGVIFLLIGVQFVFKGMDAVEILRGDSEHLAGAIAMPVMIGPGTISASVVIGERLDSLLASLAIIVAVFASVGVILLLKALHDYVRPRNERLIERYIEITGRVTALFVGTIAVQMVMAGLTTWLKW
jgi:multiple antibiotic resistance protein